MRLTLRTLLAYMDDILDPIDQEELGRKIEASPFATELIHRSRDAVRRLRLSAPEVLGGDSDDLHDGDRNLDANTAAEYLDNTLSPDEVADFERSCLEAGPHADMLLAEAASCHHILTLVLGEPAEVDADLRQRMYELSKHSGPAEARAPAEGKHVRIEPSHRTPEVMPAEPLAAAVVGRRRVDPDEESVPDYMLEAARARRSARRRLVGALVLAAVVGGGATAFVMSRQETKVPDQIAKAAGDVDKLNEGVVIGPDESTSAAETTDAATADASPADDGTGGVAPPFVPTPPETQTPAPATSETPPVESTTTSSVAMPPAEVVTSGAEVASEPATSPAPESGSSTFEVTPPAVEPEPPSAEATGTTPAGVGVDASNPPAVPSPTELPAAGATTPAATAPVDPAASLPAASLPGDTSLPADASPPVIPTEDAAAMAPTGTDSGAAPAAAAGAEAGVQPGAASPDAESAASQASQLGAYLGNEDVLLRFEPSANAWLRLPPRSTLAAGDRLLVFPTFRTHVVLGKDMNAFFSGGTEATLLTAGEIAGDARGDFGLAIPYGRVILNSGAAGNRVALALGDEVRVIELGPSSSLAIDVARRFVPGIDPGKETYPLEVTYYLTTGKASWGEGQTAEGQATWATIDGEDKPPQSIEALPEWINAEQLSGLDQSARDVVKDALAAGQPVAISLLELTDPSRRGKRIEVRGLAGKSAAFIGEFEPLVKSLSDTNERPKWKDRVETLRDAVARDPSSAQAIADTFAVDRGQTAAGDLMEMLLGFNSQGVGANKETVKDGALVRLINWMDNDDLSYRVLASYNVNEITGTTSLGGYRPEHAAQKRKSELRFYWDRLEKGDLLPRTWTPLGWAGK